EEVARGRESVDLQRMFGTLIAHAGLAMVRTAFQPPEPGRQCTDSYPQWRFWTPWTAIGQRLDCRPNAPVSRPHAAHPRRGRRAGRPHGDRDAVLVRRADAL